MTTKKQRRERVAAKRAIYDAETKRLGLEAQKRDDMKREQKLAQVEQEKRKRTGAAAVKKIKEGILPDNVAISYANSQAIDFPRMENPDLRFEEIDYTLNAGA